MSLFTILAFIVAGIVLAAIIAQAWPKAWAFILAAVAVAGAWMLSFWNEISGSFGG